MPTYLHPDDTLTTAESNALTSAIVALIRESGATEREALACLTDARAEIEADEPEPVTEADLESRDIAYRQSMIDAGRGHLLR